MPHKNIYIAVISGLLLTLVFIVFNVNPDHFNKVLKNKAYPSFNSVYNPFLFSNNNNNNSNSESLSCLPKNELDQSRFISFKECNGYTVKHLGLNGVKHNAGQAIEGGGTNYLLESLGVYSNETKDRPSTSTEDNKVYLSNKVQEFELEQKVLDTHGQIVTVKRSYIIQRPTNYYSRLLYPVVFAFHGHGGLANQWVNALSDLIDKHNFIAVYPQGYLDSEAVNEEGDAAGTSWNLGQEESTADDIEFVQMIIEKIKFLSPDSSMRFAIGNSNGAGFVSFLVSNSPTKLFTGIGMSVSGLIKESNSSTTVTMPASGKTYSYGLPSPIEPLNLVAIYGMSDPIIPYCGGPAKTGHILNMAEAGTRLWAEKIGCTDAESATVQLFDAGTSTDIDLSNY